MQIRSRGNLSIVWLLTYYPLPAYQVSERWLGASHAGLTEEQPVFEMLSDNIWQMEFF
jgi:hypothetical protein